VADFSIHNFINVCRPKAEQNKIVDFLILRQFLFIVFCIYFSFFIVSLKRFILRVTFFYKN